MQRFCSSDDCLVLHLDFHKSLPCPKLSSQDWYYKSKIQLRVFGIYNGKTGILTAYLWPETDGSKGPNEIISCIEHYLRNKEVTSRSAIVWSDNCRSETKNNTVCWYFDNLVERGVFRRLDFKTLVAGHCFSSCDRMFALIDRHAKNLQTVETPQEWQQVVNDSSVNGKIETKMMTFNDFKNYSDYFRNKYTTRYNDVNNKKMYYTDIHHFNFGIGERVDVNTGEVRTYRHKGLPWLRKTMNPREEPVVMDFVKKKQCVALDHCYLKPLFLQQIPLTRKVWCDVQSLAESYLSAESREWYNKLPLESHSDEQ